MFGLIEREMLNAFDAIARQVQTLQLSQILKGFGLNFLDARLAEDERAQISGIHKEFFVNFGLMAMNGFEGLEIGHHSDQIRTN